MKNRSYHILIAVLAVALFTLSCKKDKEVVAEVPESPKPVADFTYKLVSKDDPFTFKFENNSKDYKEIRWEFGDDTTTTVVSPVHTYIATSEYRVRMIAKNDQGYWAQKETKIKLHPDSVLSIGSTTSTDGKITLALNNPIKTASVSWYKWTGTTAVLVVTAPTATVTVPAGTYDTYSAKIVTPNGSKAELKRLVGSVGILKDVTTNGIFSVLRDNDSGPASKEGSLKLIDNDLRSKFVLFNYKGEFWAELDFKENPQIIEGYSLTSGDDAIERDPKNFSLEGSDNHSTWIVVDQHVGESFPTRNLTKTYIFNNPKAYRYYRLKIPVNNGAGLLQLSEWRVLVMQ